MRPRAIHVHLDTIVLQGLTARQRHGLVGGLRDELARQLARPEVIAALTAAISTPFVNGGRVAGGDVVGARLGRAAALRVIDRLRS